MRSEAGRNGCEAVPLTTHQSVSVHKFSVQHQHLPVPHPCVLGILQTRMMQCAACSPAATNSPQTAAERPRHSYSFARASHWIWCTEHVLCQHDSSYQPRDFRYPCLHICSPAIPSYAPVRTGDSPFFSGEENLAPRRVCIFAFSQPTLCCVVSVTLHTHPLLFYTDL